MITRRDFIKAVTGVIAALTTSGVPIITEPKPLLEYQGIPIKPIPRNGIEVLEGTQAPDSDYLQITIIRWVNEKLVARKSLRFTRAHLKLTYDLFRVQLRSDIEQASKELLDLPL